MIGSIEGEETGSVSVNISWHESDLVMTVHAYSARRSDGYIHHDPNALDALAADLQELAAEIRRRREAR